MLEKVRWINTLVEISVVRGVDFCLTYVSNALQLIYQHHAGALMSNEVVPLNYVLQFASMDELVHALVEKRVHSLSHRSLGDLDEYLLKRLLRFPCSGKTQRVRAVRLVDMRNQSFTTEAL